MGEDDLRDIFASVGAVRVKRMFGGFGISRDERTFAVVIGGELYLKADALTAVKFREAGSRPFTYERRGRPVSMGYWTVPSEALEDPDAMRPWAELALSVARPSAPRRARTRRDSAS